MTGKTEGWLVNSQISLDIVRWPAVEVFLTKLLVICPGVADTICFEQAVPHC